MPSLVGECLSSRSAHMGYFNNATNKSLFFEVSSTWIAYKIFDSHIEIVVKLSDNLG